MRLLKWLLTGKPLNRKVRMKASVGNHVAGTDVRIDPLLADQYIARGYAVGEYSRPYTATEVAALRGNNQTVRI